MDSKKLKPGNGYVYSGAGQCIESIAAMTHSLHEEKKPILIALYEALNENGYGKNPDIIEAHNLFPGAFLQIGLQLPTHNTPELEKIGNGLYDREIKKMLENYKSVNLPIFLRIGYEFDGEWNGYEPLPYKKAYRRIVDKFRENNVENVAFVWNTYTCSNDKMYDWYPDNPDTYEKDGDSYVDWFSYNTLSPDFDASWFMEQAAAHNKPVMIGESSYAIVDASYSFKNWINDFFKAIYSHGVKGYQYINWEWQVYPQNTNWTSWMNGRFTGDSSLVDIYNGQMECSDILFRGKEYHEPVAIFVDCARALKENDKSLLNWARHMDHYTGRKEYDYHVRDALGVYGDGWQPFWISIEDHIEIEFSVPGGIKGYFIFSILSEKNKNNRNMISFSVESGTKKYRMYKYEGGYHKIPIFEDDIKENKLTYIIRGQSHKVKIVQSGIVLLSDKALPAPDKIWPEKRKGSAFIKWNHVEGACFYNVYKDNQLIGMADCCCYNIGDVDKKSVINITAYHKKTGEGPMSENKAVDV